MALLLVKLLSRESIGRDYDNHWPAQTLRVGLLRLQRGGNGALASRLWGARASSGSSVDGLETESCTGSGEVEAGALPFPGLCTSRTTIGVDLPVSGSSRCFAIDRFRFHCSFADRVAAPAARTAGEVLEPACF
jgi:hypothetical protein